MSVSIREQERDNALLLRTSHSQLEFSIWGAAFKLLRGDRLLLKSGTGWGEPCISLVHWQIGQIEAVLTYNRGAHGLGRLIVTALDDGWRLAWDQPTRDTFDLESGGHWYGHGTMTVQAWPLEHVVLPETPFITGSSGSSDLGNVLTPVWITSTGVALYIERFSDSLEVGINSPLSAEKQVSPEHTDDDNPILASSASKSGLLSLCDRGAALSYALMLGADVPTAYQRFARRIGKPDRLPTQGVPREPIWMTWLGPEAETTQSTILEYAGKIRGYDLPGSALILDEHWERQCGDLAFDSDRFPDGSGMIRQLNEMGFSVMARVSPLFEAQSEHGEEAARKQFTVMAPDGNPHRIQWRNRTTYLLDASSPYALEWWAEKLLDVQRDLGISGFQFDGGEAIRMPADAVTHTTMERNDFSSRYNEFVARRFPYSEVRFAWQNQRSPIGIRHHARSGLWNAETGLASVITTSLNLSMCGYFFGQPGAIGGEMGQDGAQEQDQELLVRWAQASALFLSMHFSLPPWVYGVDTVDICRRYAQLHVNLADERISAAEDALVSGNPPIRPIFWANPRDSEAQTVADEYMLGDKFLVAPVVHQGMSYRDVYLPAGAWRDYWSGTLHSGRQWLREYPAPIDVLPLFIKAI